MNAEEIIKIISKQWCSLDDLVKLTGLSRNSALTIRKKIREKNNNNNNYLPTKLLSMKDVVSYLNIDINYLQEISEVLDEND